MNVIRAYHNDLAHCGLKKIIHGLSEHYWFSFLRKRVHDHINNCVTCLTSNTSYKSSENKMQIMDTTFEPFQILYMDHFGLLSKGSKHILVVIDVFTRFIWFFLIKSIVTKEVLKHLSSLFKILENPERVVPNRESAFISCESLFKETGR